MICEHILWVFYFGSSITINFDCHQIAWARIWLSLLIDLRFKKETKYKREKNTKCKERWNKKTDVTYQRFRCDYTVPTVAHFFLSNRIYDKNRICSFRFVDTFRFGNSNSNFLENKFSKNNWFLYVYYF